MTDARSPIRALRAAVFALVCVTLAAVGHSLTSEMSGGPGDGSGVAGHEISFGALLTAFVVIACVAWCAGGRRRGTPAIGAGLLTVQGGLHLIFAGGLPLRSRLPGVSGLSGLSGPSGLPEQPGPPYGMSASAHGSHAGPAGGTAAGAGAELGESAALGWKAVATAFVLDGSAGMLAAHLLAAAVCALWLARGEAALFRLAHAVAALAFTPLRLRLTPVRPPAAPRLIRPRSGAATAHRFRAVVLAHTVSRRGPPPHRTTRATAPGAAAPRTALTV